MSDPTPTANRLHTESVPAPLDWIVERLEALCAHDTTTGQEDQGLPALRAMLLELGADVLEQPIAPGRTNVLARWGEPRLLFSTHLDTVPPYLPPVRARDVLRGRGTCDAKGQALVQLAVIQDLLEQGQSGFAWLGVVGEETDSIGALGVPEIAQHWSRAVALINGEPTDNKLATGQRGVLHLRLTTRGVAAHSGTPERGRSALWPLLAWLEQLRSLPTRADAELGPEIWNLGLLEGGEAPNVIPAHASANLFVRSLPDSRFAAAVRAAAPDAEAHVEVLLDNPPDRYPQVPGFEHAIVPFGSDAPKLRKLVKDGFGTLVGPGHIELAHSLDEHIEFRDLERGFVTVLRLAKHLLAARGGAA